MSTHITLDHHDGIAHITFARPERLNAFDFEMGRQYRDACLSAVADPDTRVILITAEGPSFCAGGDVLTMAQADVPGSALTDGARVINEGILALTEAPIPVVAGVRGAVAGGGIGLMLAADYVVAGAGLRVAGKYADVGLSPDLGVSTLLAQAIGQRRALQLLLTNRELNADQALEWGLVAEVAQDADVSARKVAERWVASASGALGQAKRLVRAGAHRTFTASLEDEAVSIGEAYERDEAKERIGAFAAASAQRKESR